MLVQIPKYLDVISPLLLVLFALAQGKVTSGRDYIFLFVVVQTLLNGFATVLYQLFDKPNLYIYNINCVVSFFILAAYLASILQFQRKYLLASVVFTLFIGFLIFNAVVLENFITEFNSNIYGLVSFLLVMLCFLYYLGKLKNPTTKNITKSTDFWYVTGILTYYTSSFFIFITFNNLTQSNNNGVRYLWPIHNVLFFIMCVYFFIGLLCKRSPEISNL